MGHRVRPLEEQDLELEERTGVHQVLPRQDGDFSDGLTCLWDLSTCLASKVRSIGRISDCVEKADVC